MACARCCDVASVPVVVPTEVVGGVRGGYVGAGGAGEDWVRVGRRRRTEGDVAEARSCEKARGCEHRKTARHGVALWPAELDARSRTYLALGQWRAPRAVGT